MGARAIESGVTLVEAMVVVSILSVLLGLAMPMFADTIDGRRVQGAAQGLAAALRAAQAEAIRRNRTVEVVFTLTAPSPASVVAAQPVAATSARNWMVRAVNPEGPADFVSGQALAGEFGPVTLSNDTVRSVGFTPTARPVDLSAGPGLPAALAAPLVLRVASVGGSRARCVAVSTGGSVRVCDPSRAAGTVAACEPLLPPGAC